MMLCYSTLDALLLYSREPKAFGGQMSLSEP